MDTASAPAGGARAPDGDLLAMLRDVAARLKAGDRPGAARVVEGILSGRHELPDGVLPWLRIAHASLTGDETSVPAFLALQTAIVLLDV